MHCKPIVIKNASGETVATGFACSRGGRTKPCADCGRRTVALCDWKLRGPKAGKTCDRPMCAQCRTNVAPEKDLCRVHAAMWAKDPRNPKNRPPGGGPADVPT